MEMNEEWRSVMAGFIIFYYCSCIFLLRSITILCCCGVAVSRSSLLEEYCNNKQHTIQIEWKNARANQRDSSSTALDQRTNDRNSRGRYLFFKCFFLCILFSFKSEKVRVIIMMQFIWTSINVSTSTWKKKKTPNDQKPHHQKPK